MTRNEKIETITTVCAAASPKDPHALNYLRLSHVLAAFRNHKANYTIGPQGFFLNPDSRTSTHVRWDEAPSFERPLAIATSRPNDVG